MPKRDPESGLVYLIHFETPYRHASHYIGFVESPEGLQNRMHEHRTGQGSRLMAAVSAAGIKWGVVRMWYPASRTFERGLKNIKSAKTLCPECLAAKEAAKNDAAV